MKFKTMHTEFTKEWRCGDVTIQRDTWQRGPLCYRLAKRENGIWKTVRWFYSLADAKAAAAWVLDDMQSDAARLA